MKQRAGVVTTLLLVLCLATAPVPVRGADCPLFSLLCSCWNTPACYFTWAPDRCNACNSCWSNCCDTDDTNPDYAPTAGGTSPPDPLTPCPLSTFIHLSLPLDSTTYDGRCSPSFLFSPPVFPPFLSRYPPVLQDEIIKPTPVISLLLPGFAP